MVSYLNTPRSHVSRIQSNLHEQIDPETIARSPPPEYEVLVVDDASADEDTPVSEEELPSLAELFGRA